VRVSTVRGVMSISWDIEAKELLSNNNGLNSVIIIYTGPGSQETGRVLVTSGHVLMTDAEGGAFVAG
jgi:hypothetical protein